MSALLAHAKALRAIDEAFAAQAARRVDGARLTPEGSILLAIGNAFGMAAETIEGQARAECGASEPQERNAHEKG